LDAVAARFLTGQTVHAGLIDTAATLTYLDLDDTVRRTYAYAKLRIWLFRCHGIERPVGHCLLP
jgi:hypothetical protein